MAALQMNNQIAPAMMKAIIQAKLPVPVTAMETWDENDNRWLWVDVPAGWEDDLERVLQELGQAVGQPSVKPSA